MLTGKDEDKDIPAQESKKLTVSQRWGSGRRPIIVDLDAWIMNLGFILKEQRGQVVFTLGEKRPESHCGKAAALVTSYKGSSGHAEDEQAWASRPKEGSRHSRQSTSGNQEKSDVVYQTRKHGRRRRLTGKENQLSFGPHCNKARCGLHTRGWESRFYRVV